MENLAFVTVINRLVIVINRNYYPVRCGLYFMRDLSISLGIAEIFMIVAIYHAIDNLDLTCI